LKKALYRLKQARGHVMNDSLHASWIMGSLEDKLTRPSSQEKEKHLLVAQIYVDDIVFGATIDSHAHEFVA
jgi:hypothetical protein